MQILGFKRKKFCFLNLLAFITLNFELNAALIDGPLGRDSVRACQARSQGDICGHAEPKARFAGLASVPAYDNKSLICSAEGACDTELVSRQRLNPQDHNFSFYNAYRSISRP